MDVISEATQNINTINNDFKKYAYNDQLILMAAAVCIGMATKDVIQTLLNDTLYPALKFIVTNSLYYWIFTILKKKSASTPFIVNTLNVIGQIAWLFLLWSIIVFVSFVLFKKLLNYNIISSQLSFYNQVGTVYEENVKPMLY
jgi:large-conductance mechanosensitive channel